jgi:hypothetical protein
MAKKGARSKAAANPERLSGLTTLDTRWSNGGSYRKRACALVIPDPRSAPARHTNTHRSPPALCTPAHHRSAATGFTTYLNYK